MSRTVPVVHEQWLTSLFSQISVVADAVALPTYLSDALETAKGSKTDAAVPTY